MNKEEKRRHLHEEDKELHKEICFTTNKSTTNSSS